MHADSIVIFYILLDFLFIIYFLPLFIPLIPLQSQYTFFHDAILEGYISGDTEITMDELDKRIIELEAVDDWGSSGFRKEFEVSVHLESITPAYTELVIVQAVKNLLCK